MTGVTHSAPKSKLLRTSPSHQVTKPPGHDATSSFDCDREYEPLWGSKLYNLQLNSFGK